MRWLRSTQPFSTFLVLAVLAVGCSDADRKNPPQVFETVIVPVEISTARRVHSDRGSFSFTPPACWQRESETVDARIKSSDNRATVQLFVEIDPATCSSPLELGPIATTTFVIEPSGARFTVYDGHCISVGEACDTPYGRIIIQGPAE